MASKVNTKFVLIAGSVVVAAVIGVAFVGLRMMNAGGEQNISRGDDLMKAGETRKAIFEYGKAVNKDRGNAQWIRTWLSAIEKYTPTTRQQYDDMYRSEYTAALRALCDADRSNPEPFRRVLNERYQTIVRFPASLASWEGLARDHDDLLKTYRGDQKGKDLLGRYHGLARSGMFAANSELDQRFVDEGIKELRAALVVDPADADSLIALLTMLRSSSERAAKAGREADRDRLRDEASAAVTGFLQRNPDSQRVKFTLLADEINTAARSGKQGLTYLDIFKASKDKITELVSIINNAAPEKTDPLVALAIAPWVSVTLPDGRPTVDAMLAHVRKGHPDDPVFLLGWARLALQFQQPDQTIELAKAVVALPDKPMSLDGAMLNAYRAQGVRIQADANFTRWENATDTKAKEDLVKVIKTLRDDLAARTSETDPQVLSIDGRFQYISGNLAAARQTISRFNDLTQRTDTAMLTLEADILDRLQQSGAAKAVYVRILELDPQNVRVLRALGKLEADQKDYKAAAEHLTKASEILPSNAEIAEMAKNARMLSTENFNDPVLKCLNDAIKLGSGLTGDQQGAIRILRDGLKANPLDLRLSVRLAEALVATNEVTEAKKILDEYIAANPKADNIKEFRSRLDVDPLTFMLDRIDKNENLNAIQKSLSRWATYMRFGKQEDAKKALDRAGDLVKENKDVSSGDRALVIDTQFEDALFRRDQPTMDALVAKAQELDLDRVGGLLYKARAQLASGKTRDSIGALREVVSKDKLNLLAWRMLGVALFEDGKPAEAVDALSRAIEIKPDDLPSVSAYIRAKVAIEQFPEALDFARKCEKMGIGSGNQEFMEMLLSLEANAVGGDREKAIAARRRIYENNPGNRGNTSKLASLLINADSPERKTLPEAAEIIKKLRETDADDIVAVELHAAWLGRSKKTEEAVAFLKNFIEKLPVAKRSDELYINIYRLLLQLGQPAEAKAMLESGRATQEPKKMLIDRELGDSLFNRGEYAESASAYQRVIDGNSEDTDFNVRKRVIECYLKLKQFEQLNAVVAKLPAAAQGDTTILLLQAEAAAGQNDRAKATKFYDQAVAANPKSPIGFIKRGQFKIELFKQGDAAMLKDAEADFTQAIRVDPNNIAARVLLFNIYKQTGRDELAINMLKDAVSIDRYNEPLRLRLVGACEEINRLDDAAQVCEDAVKQFNSLPWKMKAGQISGRAGKWDIAVEYFKKVWMERRAPETAVALIESLLNKGDTLNAHNVIIAITAGKEVDIDRNLPLRMLRARVNAKQGLTAQAAQEVAASLPLVKQDSYEDSSIFISGIAGIYAKRSEQIAALTRIEGATPFTGYLALKVNELRAREPETKAAGMAALEKLAGSDQDKRIRGGAWSLLGTLAYADNNWPTAHERFKKGIELDPENIELNNNLAYVLAAKLDKGAEALPFAEKAAKAAPQNSGFLDTLGICQYAAKMYPQAAITFSSALQVAVNDSERIPVYIHTGWLRVKQGDKIEARRVAARARELMSNLPSARDAYMADLTELDKAIDGK